MVVSVGNLLQGLWSLVVWGGAWNLPPCVGPGDQGPLAGNPDTSPGALRSKAPVVREAVRDGCGCGDSASRFLGLRWVGVGCRMCLRGLGSREMGHPAMNADTHLSRGRPWIVVGSFGHAHLFPLYVWMHYCLNPVLYLQHLFFCFVLSTVTLFTVLFDWLFHFQLVCLVLFQSLSFSFKLKFPLWFWILPSNFFVHAA